MNNTVQLFFNHPCQMPVDGDKWNNWQDPDTTKLAWVAGESWRRNGWKVRRLDCSKEIGFKPFTGRLAESVKFYPAEFFNVWYTMERICKEQGPTIVSTIDVINYGMTPGFLNGHIRFVLGSVPVPCNITFQSQHYSASCVLVDAAGCRQIIDAIRAYDAGMMATIDCDLVSDETIIRNYVPYVTIPWQRYSVEPDANKARLVHIPRSALTRCFDSDAANAINQ